MKKIVAITLLLIMVLSMASVIFADNPSTVGEISEEIGNKSDELRVAIAGVLAKVASTLFFVCLAAGLFGGSQKFKSFLKYALMVTAIVGIVSWGWVGIENFLLK